MNWKNDLTAKLNIEFPFIQAPMYGITTPEMVARVSNTGCLGSLALGQTNSDDASALIRAVKKQTRGVFSVNLFAYNKPAIGKIPPMVILRSVYSRYGLKFPEDLPSEGLFPAYED